MRVARFIAVGTMAALVHWLIVVISVHAGALPLWANPMGWAGAFGVSWAGHQHWTFVDARAPVQRSLPRFAAISLGGFLVNQASYAALLQGTELRFDLALGLVLIGVAVLTWIASRLWAFTGTDPRR